MRVDFLLIHNQKKRQHYRAWCWAVGLEIIFVLIIGWVVHRVFTWRIEQLQHAVFQQETMRAKPSLKASSRILPSSVSAFLGLLPRLAAWLPADGVVDHVIWNQGAIEVVGHCLSCASGVEWSALGPCRLNRIEIHGDRFVLKIEDVQHVASR